MPVREIPRNYSNVTGSLSTRKCKGSPRFESLLEQDLMIRLEFDRKVKSYEMQPVTIRYIGLGGKLRSYTPDILIEYDDSVLLVEVKYRKHLKEIWQQEKAKYKAAVSFAKKQGWRFKLLTDIEIRTPYLENVKFLRSIEQEQYSEEWLDPIKGALIHLRESTPQGLMAYLCEDKWNQAQVLRVIWHLMREELICTDLSLPLTMYSPIWYRPELQ